MSTTTTADGTTIRAHSNYRNPNTADVDLSEVGGIDGFFGNEREPGYSAQAFVTALWPTDDGSAGAEDMPNISPDRAISVLTTLADWAERGDADIGGLGLNPDASASEVSAAAIAAAEQPILMIAVYRGRAADDRLGAERAAHVFVRAPNR